MVIGLNRPASCRHHMSGHLALSGRNVLGERHLSFWVAVRIDCMHEELWSTLLRLQLHLQIILNHSCLVAIG